MFGKNEIVGKKYFEDVQDKLFITSKFMTMQGEGPLRGEPAFFVRFAKCNLACSFCDTFFDGGTWYTISELEYEIDQDIKKFFDGDTPQWAAFRDAKRRKMALVVTGGEPMLQKNIVPFLEAMNRQFDKTQIESNGLLYQDIPGRTILVCSPKCLEKDGRAIRYYKPNKEVLDRADCLKFVMEDNPESPYHAIPDWAFEWRERFGDPIFISPMNIYNNLPQKAKELRAVKDQNDITIEERSTTDEVISFWEPGLLDMVQNKRNHEYAAKYCVKNGLTFNLQTHLFASLA